jgi:hypothetical protein
MKVEELIGELEKLDGSKEIRFFSFIEIGRGGSWIDVEWCEIEDEDDSYVLKISGSEDEDGGSE